MQSQIENYRAKAREFARLAAVAKSRRDARHHRKFADIYWALALYDEPKRFQPRQMAVAARAAVSDDQPFTAPASRASLATCEPAAPARMNIP
jgi:hypothetical protein